AVGRRGGAAVGVPRDVVRLGPQVRAVKSDAFWGADGEAGAVVNVGDGAHVRMCRLLDQLTGLSVENRYRVLVVDGQLSAARVPRRGRAWSFVEFKVEPCGGGCGCGGGVGEAHPGRRFVAPQVGRLAAVVGWDYV